ncbi:helix-turn-helix domain-containing protein [Nocardioides sp.]|uniref:helix-turn-helix domain-containing protein n=1 Tax=Nocardioides sp. TaxID=35761 RepID=UPI002621D7FB|nr:helix-turn-helix domain-containing protein [Nocardioides sp.]MCW2736100.1 binding domain, excisionase family [Nocardioides sp.]
MPDYMTTTEVADLLRTPVETVRYWRHVSKGPKSFKVGRRVLYAREDVEAFLAEARTGVGPDAV